MTDAVELTDEEKNARDERITDQRAALDAELQTLLDFMLGGIENERDDNSFGITLFLPTGVIRGLAITRKVWSGRMNDALRGAGAELIADAREQVSEAVELKLKEMWAALDAEGRPKPPRRFIHLKDAQIQSGGASFDLRNTRVDLAQVSGWELGS